MPFGPTTLPSPPLSRYVNALPSTAARMCRCDDPFCMLGCCIELRLKTVQIPKCSMLTSAKNLSEDHALVRKFHFTFYAFLLVSAGEVRAAESLRLVVIPYDASWGSRRHPVAPFPQLLPPLLPEIKPTFANQISVPTPSKQWCGGGC